MDKYDIIMNAEDQFAREVTLGVIVTRPLTAWHYMIPGFFIIDFLRRGSAVRQYTKYFMYPRTLAMDAALAVSRQEDKETLNSRIREDIRSWLEEAGYNKPSGDKNDKQVFIKNIPFSEPQQLAELVYYEEGRVVSRTFAQNPSLRLTLFA